MKVYLVMSYMDYEGSDIEEIFSTEKKANEYRLLLEQNQDKEWKNKGYPNPCSFGVEPHEVLLDLPKDN